MYDTTFIGKWPKEEYYEVFKPVIIKDVDLKYDEEFQRMMKNNIASIDDTFNNFYYVDWYNYMKNNTINFHPIRENLKLVKFPNE